MHGDGVFDAVLLDGSRSEELDEMGKSSRSASELVVGLVGAVGTNLAFIRAELDRRLRSFRYSTHSIQVSSDIIAELPLSTPIDGSSELLRLRSYMSRGDEARESSGNTAILAYGVANKIAQVRGRKEPDRRRAYIVSSLKHPAEVKALRKVYGEGFFLFGVYSSPDDRRKYLHEHKQMTLDDADSVMSRDFDEGEPFGQRTRDTFHMSDFFVNYVDQDGVSDQLQRFLDIIFGNPYLTPDRDEYSMFLAFSAALRSADLSRQVGAVVVSEKGDIISTGANDVPCAGGGLYWPGDDDMRDHVKGYDSNHMARRQIAAEAVQSIAAGCREKCRSDVLREGETRLAGTPLMDISEFGRSVHAEMEALLCCARSGVSLLHATLYCTTFPCHNCAKHIVAAGIKRVVFVEPYPKSRAQDLFSDSIEVGLAATGGKVNFQPFVGVGPSRFFDLFTMRLGPGGDLVREKGGETVKWQRGSASLRIAMLPSSYMDREKTLAAELENWREKTNGDAVPPA